MLFYEQLTEYIEDLKSEDSIIRHDAARGFVKMGPHILDLEPSFIETFLSDSFEFLFFYLNTSAF